MNKVLLSEAARHYGLHEESATVRGWIRQQIPWAGDAKIAWCGIFLWAVATASGAVAPPKPFRALSWQSAGSAVRVDAAMPGDVVILRRKGGLHVGLVVCIRGSSIWVLGGNQKNMVCVKEFALADLKAIRRLG